MRHTKIEQVLFALIVALCLWSCNEDKGNYSYEEINKVTRLCDIESEYTVEVGEQLNINPTLETTFGDETDLVYTWYYSKGSSNWEVLQEGKNLNFTIADPIGMPNSTYTCAFEAKNQKTGAAYRQTFTIRVSGTFNRGYVILYEKDNSFDIGMLVRNAVNQYIAKYDILATTAPELEREGVKPYELNIFNDQTAPNPYNTDGSKRSVYLLTDHYTTRLKVADFTWDSSYDISNSIENGSTLYVNYKRPGISIIAEKMKVGFFSVNGTIYPHIYIYVKDGNGNGDWYMSNNFPVVYFFSYAMNAYRDDKGKTPYTPAPYLSCGGRGTMFFNEDTNTFAYQLLPSSNEMGTTFFYTQSFRDESTDHVFNFNAENSGLLYQGERYNSVTNMTDYAILKQKDGTFKFIEYYNASNITSLVTKSYKLRACIFEANSPIKDAKFITAAPSPNDAFIYFATKDNRIFYADITGETATVRDITDKVLTDGYSEVTALRFVLPGATDKYLAIATYNNSLGKDKGGKLVFYSMPNASSGELSIAEHKVNDDETIQMSWKDFGKIVSLDYKP